MIFITTKCLNIFLPQIIFHFSEKLLIQNLLKILKKMKNSQFNLQQLMIKVYFQNKNYFLQKLLWCRTSKDHLNHHIWVLMIYPKKKALNHLYLHIKDNIQQLCLEIIKYNGIIIALLINYQSVKKLLNSYKIKDKSYMKYRNKKNIEIFKLNS